MQTILDEAPTKPVAQGIELSLAPKAAQLPALHDAPAEAASPFRAVEMAVERGMPVDVIEKLIAAAERMEAMRERERLRQAELAFRRAFAAFTGENVIVPKTKTVNREKAGSFDQAEFDKVMGMLKPPLSKHGFGIRHDMRFDVKQFPPTELNPTGMCPWVYVTCYLEHEGGHRETLDLDGPAGDLQANTPVQNMQVTGSYFKRQSALAITGTPTAEEDNEERLKRNQKADAKQDEFERVLGDLRAAAVDGTDALTKKWGQLSPHERNLMSREFGKLKKDAAKADKPVSHEQQAGGDFGDDTMRRRA